jgi:hypothetical protein
LKIIKSLQKGEFKMAEKKEKPKGTPTEGSLPNPNAPVSKEEQQEEGKVQYPRRSDDPRKPGE